jgi:hypothetical protein
MGGIYLLFYKMALYPANIDSHRSHIDNMAASVDMDRLTTLPQYKK